MKEHILCFVILLVFLSNIQAQQPLPKYLTGEEKEQLPAYYNDVIKESSSRTLVEIDNPRCPAEWEEMQGVAIAWDNYFKDIQSEIVRYAQEEGKVYVISSNIVETKSALVEADVSAGENVVFIEGAYNSLWIRDYGPNSVYLNDVDSLVFIDWIYNRPRYEDDKIPDLLGDHLSHSVIHTDTKPEDLVHTGGNFMSNGKVQGFSSRLVDDENGPTGKFNKSHHSPEDVNALMEKYMGIEDYVKMTALPYDLIHHIDMHMKIVNEETLIVGQYPEGVSDGPQIEANIQYILDNYRTAYGNRYNVVRVPMPADDNGQYPNNYGDYRTYANALILNKLILVPIYATADDEVALDIWRKTMPGYKVVGIDCNKIIPLSGAIHCITKEIAVKNPIWISHESIKYPDDVYTHWDINAQIMPSTENDQRYVHYSIDGGMTYDSLELKTSADPFIYNANMYDATNGVDSVLYYIKVTTSNGRSVKSPLTGGVGGGWKYYPNKFVSTADVSTDIHVGDIFPNPASSIAALPLTMNRSQHVKATLVDMNGKIIETLWNGDFPIGKTHLFFNASDYSAGNYVIHIDMGQHHFSKKAIIIR